MGVKRVEMKVGDGSVFVSSTSMMRRDADTDHSPVPV